MHRHRSRQAPPRLRRSRRRRHGPDVVRARAAAVGDARARPPSASPRRTASQSRSSPRWKQCARGLLVLRRLRPLAARGRRRRDRRARGRAPSALTREEIEHARQDALGRKIVVVGACTGSDAHTVGIDAILNYKGYAGDKGLESYKGFDAYNLGAQVENDRARRARAARSTPTRSSSSQVITQRNCHKENARALVELARERGLARRRDPPPRRAAHRSQARARARLRRRLRPGDEARGRRVVPRRPPRRTELSTWAGSPALDFTSVLDLVPPPHTLLRHGSPPPLGAALTTGENSMTTSRARWLLLVLSLLQRSRAPCWRGAATRWIRAIRPSRSARHRRSDSSRI